MKNTLKSSGRSLISGFTLIELLVVIAIVGILATIVLIDIAPAKSAGKDAAIESQMNSLRNAIENVANGGDYTADALTGSATSDDDNIKAIITGITNQGSTLVTQQDAGTWSASASLISSTTVFWCVDSDGFAGTTSIAVTTTKCN